MKKKNLVIINNEKMLKDGESIFCDNLDLKVLPEGLSHYYDVEYIVRKSKKRGGQKLNLKNIKISSNIISFISNVLRTFKNNPKFLIISITPYTFLTMLILFLFRKKTILYLWSDGHEEWKYILGSWSVWIFHLMFIVCTKADKIIVCNKRLVKKESHLISISRLDNNWFANKKEPELDKVKFLYVGRLSAEKGIFNFLEIFKKTNLDSELSIVGNPKNHNIKENNVKMLGYISDPNSLKNVYDDHNITVLPSYTEGYPYVVDESLSRDRPVIVFEEISYVVNNKKGIFVCKRDLSSFEKTVNDIIKNYKKVQEDIRNNKLPTKESMLRQISNIIGN